MASTVSRTPAGIIYTPDKTLPIPELDICTLLFDSPHCPGLEDKVLHADAFDPSNHLTKGQTRRESKRLAHVLRNQYGIGALGPSQDVVYVVSTGHYQLPLFFYATVAAEGIFSSASPAVTPEELAAQLRQTDAKLLICTEQTKKTALAAAANVGLPPSRVLCYGGEGPLALVEAAGSARVPMSNQELQWRRITDRHELETSVVCLLFSSGTTGLPKAMGLSHLNMVAAPTLLLEPSRDYIRTQRSPDWEYVALAHLPVAHIAGVQGYFMHAAYMGGTLYWMPRFDFVQFCDYNRRYRCTTGFSVPPIFLLISKSPHVTDHFASWTDAVAGAAPMGEDLQVAVSKKLGIPLRQTWGLSETTGSVTTVPLEMADAVPRGTVGGLVPNHDARIVDDEGRDVEPGSPGEILVRGPLVIRGYWKNDAATAEAFRDGWFHTGDVAVFRDGWFYIMDRKKELIKYKGLQVAPAELEAVLLSNPKILDAAVIGVPGDGTELPRAYVVADPKQISEDEIKNFVSQHVSKYKQLRGGVAFVSAIPKSPSGKILRKELRERAKKEALSPKL